MSSTTLPPVFPEEGARRSPTMAKGLQSVRKRKDRLNTDSLYLSYADLVKESLVNYASLVKEKDSCSIIGNTFQPFAEPREIPREIVNLPVSPNPSLSSTSTSNSHVMSPTTPRFSKEVDPFVIGHSSLDVISVSKRNSDLPITLTSPSDDSRMDYRGAPRSASPKRTIFEPERRPHRRRRDSDSGLDVAMFHQRLGRRNDHRRSTSSAIIVPHKASSTPIIKHTEPIAVALAPTKGSPVLKSSSGLELSKPLPPHPSREYTSPYELSSRVKQDQQKGTQLAVVPATKVAVQNAQTRLLQRMSDTIPERGHSPAPSISFSLTRMRLKRMASKAVFMKKQSSDMVEPWDASPHRGQESFQDDEPLIGNESSAISATSPVLPAYYEGRDEWDASELRSGTPMPRLDIDVAREVEEAQRVRVVMAMGNVWQERDVLDVLPTLRMLKDPTKSGRAH